MEIRRVGSRSSAKGPPEWFTGTVRIAPLFEAHDPRPDPGDVGLATISSGMKAFDVPGSVRVRIERAR
jgi:hypothetical protein